MEPNQAGLLRALCFHTALGYAPTRAELVSSFDNGGDGAVGAIHELPLQEAVIELRGRCVLTGHEDLIEEHERREAMFSRKVRRARAVTRWLRRIGGVRFVAVCNTTALAHARDVGDIDFFIIGRAGGLWQTRLWSVLPFWLLRRRPSESRGGRDAVCLSFFVDDEHLNLRPLMLGEDDVYFRHWFLSFLPLYDDGIGQELWRQNASIRERHPDAREWIISPDLRVKPVRLRIPSLAFLEKPARTIQTKTFSTAIREAMNRDTRVVVRDGVLKFHVEDAREKFRQDYQRLCEQYGIES